MPKPPRNVFRQDPALSVGSQFAVDSNHPSVRRALRAIAGGDKGITGKGNTRCMGSAFFSNAAREANIYYSSTASSHQAHAAEHPPMSGANDAHAADSIRANALLAHALSLRGLDASVVTFVPKGFKQPIHMTHSSGWYLDPVTGRTHDRDSVLMMAERRPGEALQEIHIARQFPEANVRADSPPTPKPVARSGPRVLQRSGGRSLVIDEDHPDVKTLVASLHDAAMESELGYVHGLAKLVSLLPADPGANPAAYKGTNTAMLSGIANANAWAVSERAALMQLAMERAGIRSRVVSTLLPQPGGSLRTVFLRHPDGTFVDVTKGELIPRGSKDFNIWNQRPWEDVLTP